MGNDCFEQCEVGSRQVISVLAAEEANLLYARQLALKKGWFGAVIPAMQGLLQLCDQIGWWVEWKRLVEEIVPFFVDLKMDGPIPGREKDWGLVTEYRVKLAIRSRQLDDALGLQKKSIEWHREKAGPALAADSHRIDKSARIAIRNYIVSIGDLAEIQREMGDAGCVLSYKEAIEKSEKYGFGPDAARVSIGLGNAYWTLAQIRDLDQAEWLIRRGLDLTAKSDGLGRGRCLITLGHVALERFLDSRKASRLEVKHLEAAQVFYKQAMDVIPPSASEALFHVHMGLGNAYRYAGMFDKALRHFQVAINYADKLGDIYLSAQCRRNAAFDLVDAGHLADAMEYARSALEKFEACGTAGAKKAQEIQELIELEKALRSE
jgi:tetratricopeptide (TPR) repeat protein